MEGGSEKRGGRWENGGGREGGRKDGGRREEGRKGWSSGRGESLAPAIQLCDITKATKYHTCLRRVSVTMATHLSK